MWTLSLWSLLDPVWRYYGKTALVNGFLPSKSSLTSIPMNLTAGNGISSAFLVVAQLLITGRETIYSGKGTMIEAKPSGSYKVSRLRNGSQTSDGKATMKLNKYLYSNSTLMVWVSQRPREAQRLSEFVEGNSSLFTGKGPPIALLCRLSHGSERWRHGSANHFQCIPRMMLNQLGGDQIWQSSEWTSSLRVLPNSHSHDPREHPE